MTTSVTSEFRGDGTTTAFDIKNVPAVGTTPTVTVNGSAGPTVTGWNGTIVALATAPAAGSLVAITFQDVIARFS
jgi:hypothetical protein